MAWKNVLVYKRLFLFLVALPVLAFCILLCQHLFFGIPLPNILGRGNPVTSISLTMDHKKANATNYESTDKVLRIVKMKRRGLALESISNHDFKSPFVFDPPHTSKIASKVHGNRKLKFILCYNCPGWFSFHLDHFPSQDCRVNTNPKNIAKADLVIFFNKLKSKKPPRTLGQIWVYCSWESPANDNFPEPYDEWKDAFNWTCGYRQDFDIHIPYGRLSWRDRESMLLDRQYEKIAMKKTKTAAWMVSNCHTQSKRDAYVKEMKKYIDIDIYGACGEGKCGNIQDDSCDGKFNSTYKFYLSFENSICKDYVTEKLWRWYDNRLQIIPVTRGGFDYDKHVPPNTFINAQNFASPKRLALHLKSLGRDVKRYSAMLREKDRLTLSSLDFEYDWSGLCDQLRLDTKPKIIQDIKKVVSENACWHEKGFN